MRPALRWYVVRAADGLIIRQAVTRSQASKTAKRHGDVRLYLTDQRKMERTKAQMKRRWGAPILAAMVSEAP